MTNIVVAGLFEPAWCAAQVARLTSDGFGEAAPAYPQRYRDNARWVADAPALAAELYARAAPHLPATWVDGGRVWRRVGLNPRMRACRYGVGQAFGVHRDGVHWASDEERSFLSVVLYLDDGFTGGHTRVFADRSAREVVGRVAPRVGTLAAFPHTLWHDGAPVESGTKHVLRTDVMYRAEGAAPVAGHRGYVWALAARDGLLLSGGRDRRLCAWRQGRPVGVVHDAHEASVTCLAVGPSAGSVISGSRDQSVARWDVDGDALRLRWRARPQAGAVLSVVWSGDSVVSAGADGRAVWLVDGAPVAATQLHRGWAWQLAVQAGVVLSVGEDGCLVRSTRSGVLTAHALGLGPLRALVVLDEAHVVVGGVDGRLHVVRVPDGEVRATWAGHDGAVTCLGRRADGALLSGGEDDRAICWGSGDELARAHEVRVHQDFVRAVCADGAGWASAGYDGLRSAHSP